jgi:hypothetical protein
MPQVPTELTVAQVEKLFHVRVIDTPQPKLSAVEVGVQMSRSWWSRRLRWGWRKSLAAIASPAPPGG